MKIVTDVVRLRRMLPDATDKDNVLGVADMLFTEMKEHSGQGLAANQVGLDLRMFVIKTERMATICLVNPMIASASEKQQESNEGCLSLPGVKVRVKRPQRIRVVGLNQYMKQVSYKFAGIEARRACHEIDHLNGRLIIDYAEDSVR